MKLLEEMSTVDTITRGSSVLPAPNHTALVDHTSAFAGSPSFTADPHFSKHSP